MQCMGFSSWWLLLLWSVDSRAQASVVAVHGFSCCAACGIFPNQGSNPCPLHWQDDSYPLGHQGILGLLLRKSHKSSFPMLLIPWSVARITVISIITRGTAALSIIYQAPLTRDTMPDMAMPTSETEKSEAEKQDSGREGNRGCYRWKWLSNLMHAAVTWQAWAPPQGC